MKTQTYVAKKVVVIAYNLSANVLLNLGEPVVLRDSKVNKQHINQIGSLVVGLITHVLFWPLGIKPSLSNLEYMNGVWFFFLFSRQK